MTLADYYFLDPRIVLVPVEHLAPDEGMSREFAALVMARRRWREEQVELFNAAFTRYWARSATLAARTAHWPPPRVRHVAVVGDTAAVRPYAQILNTSAWLLYETDFDPNASHLELAAYLFQHGDWMASTGEVTEVAVRSAAYWFDRTDDECQAFAAAASRSRRPDADGIRAVAAATPWLRRLHHETLRPATLVGTHRAIPGTGLLVPRDLEAAAPALVERFVAAAGLAVSRYQGAFTSPPAAAIRDLCGWLAEAAPPLLVTAERGRILWEPAHPERLGAVRSILKRADATAVQVIHGDLDLIAQRTRAFHAALADYMSNEDVYAHKG